MRGRLGLGADSPLDVRTATYETPFDWKRQVRAFLSRDADPDPQRVAHLVVRMHKRIQRNMLVLFTSHAALRRAKAILAEELPVETPLWAQNVDGDATELADRFRNIRGAVLLGTSSFWEGVDFPGAALEVLIITKLPFSVAADPLMKARCERIEESGGSGFRALLLPDAVLRFRQGIGRLLRRKTDRGIVVLTDPRAVTRSYGSVFRRALPVPLTETASDEELAQAAFRFLEEDSQSGSSPVSEQPMNAESKQ